MRKEINVPTRIYNDSYRQIGYLTNDDDPVKTWKVIGKQSERNRGQFYIIPTNTNYDMKIQLTDDIMVGQKLKDVDNLPSEVQFKTPLLAATPYVLTELPRNFNDEFL
jgi:hypothetical protein